MSIRITLGKCWQTPHGALVFQCSTHDGTRRQKGFLELSPARARDPVSFSVEKPATELKTSGVATLIRKHMTSGALTGIAINDESPSNKEFIRVRAQGKSASGQPSELFLVVSTRPEREINIIHGLKSVARLRESATYTVAKVAPAEFLEPSDLDSHGFSAWSSACFDSTQATPSPGEKDASGPNTRTNPSSKTSESTETHPIWQRHARDRVARRLKTLNKTLIQDQGKIPTAERIQDAKTNADLLRNYLWMVKPDAFELRLDAAQTNDRDRVISLNPDLSPGANLESLFAQIKKMERSIALGAPRVDGLRAQIRRFERALDNLRDPAVNLSEQEVLTILRDLGLEARTAGPTKDGSKTTQPVKANARCFLTAGGQRMLVGRNADESDRLVKSARSQDWWLHIAGGAHGSHVIIPAVNTLRESVPDDVLREAGILALHFSERSESREGEVYIARRHQIKKRKGMAAGLWQIDRAKTVVIRYEPEELRVIFSREHREGVQRHHDTSHTPS